MSRINPNSNATNPATMWFEWSGSEGHVQHFDKAAKKNIKVKLPFTMLILEECATIKGWNDGLQKAVFSNEVRDTRTEPLFVRYHKGGVIASGLYSDIKEKIKAADGNFAVNCYIAYKSEGELKIGSFMMKGCARSAWFDFRKKHGQDIYKGAVQIIGSVKGKNGGVTYQSPEFKLIDCTPGTDAKAKELNIELEAFLKEYFVRSQRTGQSAPANEPEAEHRQDDEIDAEASRPDDDVDLHDASIPF